MTACITAWGVEPMVTSVTQQLWHPELELPQPQPALPAKQRLEQAWWLCQWQGEPVMAARCLGVHGLWVGKQRVGGGSWAGDKWKGPRR